MEALSVYGPNGVRRHPDDSEAEVLFAPRTRFEVLEFEVVPPRKYVRITLAEV